MLSLTGCIPVGVEIVISFKIAVFFGKCLGESPRVKDELVNYHSRLFSKYLLNVCLSVCGVSGHIIQLC